MSIGKGWLGHPDDIVSVLTLAGADKDEEGRFLIFSSPVVSGLDGDVLVPADAEYSIAGKRANLAALLSATSYGVSVGVVA